LGKTLIIRGSVQGTNLVAPDFQVVFQLSQCDMALPSAMWGLYLLLAFLITSSYHHWSPL
jgi:hypothetical protein